MKVKRSGGDIKSSFLLLITLLILLLFLTPVNPCLAQIADESNLTTQVITHLVGNGTLGPYQLKDHFILEATERIKKNGLLLDRNQDYLLDYNHGRITLSLPLYPSDTLLISYQKLNFNLRRKYFHRELIFGDYQDQSTGFDHSTNKSTTGLKSGKWSFLPNKSSTDVVLSGSKTFSLELGSAQDLSLKQGLWLSAKGKATKNMEISLQVSDQNMPATSEGTTKRLEELDKVQILVQSPNFSGRLGDYYLKPSGSEFFLYEKKLQGVMAEATSGKSSFGFALASSGGEYFNNKFLGQDNKQGPYQLQGKNKETNIMILPGTEQVWVDGEKMERGSGHDYTIDYNRGTIQFTPQRLITSDSRITVDFEYSVDNYRRDLYGGNLATSLFEGKLELKASGILEQDNRSHPSSFSLSSEEKDILSRAGDNRLAASKEGATFVGRGEGDYDLVYDSSGTPYYQYVGNDSGSYEVSFSWVGEKEGSYEYMGGGIYRYVYPDNGDFLPVVLLPLPESHSLFDLNLNYSPLHFLETQIEWAKSKSDKNTFSERDDHHMWGDALSVRTIYRNVDFQFLKSNFHRLELQGEYGLLTEDFAPFGRINQVERERKWGLPQESISGDEKTYQFSGLISPWRFLILDFDYGELKKEGSFTSQRRNLEAEVSLADWISIKGKSELIRSKEITSERLKGDDVWTRNMVALNNKYRKLSATFCWEQERRSFSDSSLANQEENFDVFSGKLNLGLSNLIKTSTQLSYRIDDTFIEDEWNKSFSYIWRNRYSMRDLQGMLSSDLEFTRRIKKNRSSLQKDSQQDLLKFSMDLYPSSQLINLKFYHSQNQIHSTQRVDTYLEVDPGSGNYCYEDGEYVSHPEGNFIRISEWVGDTQPSLDLNKSIRLIFSPHKVSSRDEGRSFWLQVGRIFSTDSFVNLRGRFKDQKALSFYFIYPLTSLSDEDIITQNVTVRHDLYLLPTYKPLHLRLRWEKSKDEDNLLSDGGLRETELKGELLLRCYASSKHSFESRIGKEEIRSNRVNDLKSLVEGRSLAFAFTRRQTQALEVKISAQYKKKDDQIQSQVAEFFSLSPEILWSLLSQGRLKAFFEWTHLRSTPDSRSLSYVLGEGKGRGENYGWRLFFDYKLNRYLTTSLVYSGESVPDKETKHTGRMEMKAYF